MRKWHLHGDLRGWRTGSMESAEHSRHREVTSGEKKPRTCEEQLDRQCSWGRDTEERCGRDEAEEVKSGQATQCFRE